MGKAIDLTGQRFGKLTVVERCGSADNRAVWRCICDCGGFRIVCGRYLRNGSAIDCGCSNAVLSEAGEIWKPIVGYENKYEVSNHGRVKSCKRFRSGKKGTPTLIAERLLVPSHDHNGYLKVCLRDGHSCSNHSVHQLVARAFIDNPNGYTQINHKDENKENNDASNLEWCTPRYNNTYGTRLERCSKRISKPVVGINGEVLTRFNSARQASRALGVCASSITAVCRGKAQTAGGYMWRYDNEPKGDG